MKKLLSLVLCLLLVGCSSNNISQEEYNVLVKENEKLTLENKQLKDQIKSYEKHSDVKITGGFVANLVEKKADYNDEDAPNRILVLQWFQGNMFVKTVDEDLANELEVGKTYYFEIDPCVVEYSQYGLNVDQVTKIIDGSSDWVRIVGYRDIKNDEGGLNNSFIKIEEVK